MAPELIVKVIGDTSQLEKSFKKAQAATGRFERNMGQAGRGSEQFAAGNKDLAGSFGLISARLLGGAGVVAAMKQSVDAASNLHEQMNKTKVVFGQSSAAILDWSDSAAKNMGLSQRAALTAAATFGNLFSTVNIGKPVAAGMSQTLVQLAADMASFNDKNPEDTLDALRSGLVGEAEPLRIFGVRLSEARVAQVAMATTGKTVAKTLTEQEKAMARYKIILADTKIQQGDFAKTSKDLANQQRTLSGNVEDLSAKIGGVFVPSLTTITGVANTLAGALGQVGEAQDKVASDEDLRRIQNLSDKYQGLKDAWLGGPLDPNAKQSATALGTGVLGVPRNPPMTTPGGRGVFGANQQTPQFQFGGAFVATVEQQNQWFDSAIGRMLERAGGIESISGQIAELRRIAALIQQRIDVTGDVTRKLTLEDQLFNIDQRVRGLNEQAASNDRLAAAATQAAAAAKKAAAAERQRLATAQRLAEIQAGFAVFDFALEQAEATKGAKDDVKALRGREAFIQDLIRHEGRTLELVRDLWQTREKIRNLNKSKSDVDPLAGLMQVGSAGLARILAQGTGLDAAGRRVLGANIAGAEIRPLVIHNIVHLDEREVGRSVTTHQTRDGNRKARQTSGRRK